MFICCSTATLIILLIGCHVPTTSGMLEPEPVSRPYMVLIQRNMEDGYIRFCAGFLLSEYYVMTAASCQAESYTVHLGIKAFQFSGDEGQNVTVDGAFPHKHYRESGYVNNLMLLKLSSKAKFNNNVSPIMTSGQDEGCQPQSCTSVGWGRANWRFAFLFRGLIETSVTLTDNDECVKDNVYCSVGGPHPQEGDVGGPLVCEGGYAYGVVFSELPSTSAGPRLSRFTKIPDSRKLTDLFFERHHVCGKAAN